jgi:hypothetical protein
VVKGSLPEVFKYMNNAKPCIIKLMQNSGTGEGLATASIHRINP